MWVLSARKQDPCLTGSRDGPMQTSWSSTTPSARSCTWVGAIPSINTDWAENGSKKALRTTCWLMKTQHELAMCPCSPEIQPHPGLHQTKHGQQVEGSDSVPPFSWEPTCCPASSSETHNIGKLWTCWNESKGVLINTIRAGLKNLSNEHRLKGPGFFSLEKAPEES